MRKYKRLSFFLLFCISLVLMFVYRHKYSKLNLVFKMMNGFSFHDCESKYNERLHQFQNSLKTDFNIQEQIAGFPYWIEIFPDVYAYSSYWLYGKTRTIFFTRNQSLKKLWKIGCLLDYEDKDIFNTKTNLKLLEKTESTLILFLECTYNHTKLPSNSHGLRFVMENVPSVPLPVIQPQNYIGNFTVCVKPLQPTFGDVYTILEFLIYYNHIGANFFIFYDTGLSLNVKKMMMDLAFKNGIYILILPWNVPFNSQTSFNHTEIYFLDCLHRVVVRNHSESILKLDINNYILTKENKNLTAVLASSVSSIKFHEKIFCTDYPSDIIAQNLFMNFVTLLNTKASNKNGLPIQIVYNAYKLKETIIDTKKFHVWLYKKREQKTNLVPVMSGIVHSYKNCKLKTENEKQDFSEDKTMWMFKDIFFKSHLYKLSKARNLIN